MELKSTFLLMIGLGMASCHWFDPTDIEDAARERPHIFVNAVMGEDSTFCSISSVSSGGVNTEEEVQACVTLEGASEALGTTCGSGASEAMGFWLPTSGLTIDPEQPWSLLVTSDRWGDMRATSQVPAAPTWSTLNLSSRAIQEGDKVFDEFELNLTRDEGEGKWHLVQLLLQVDTVLAPPPTARNLWSDDPHVLVRKHGGPALDNALLVGNDGWVGREWNCDSGSKTTCRKAFHITTSSWSIPFRRNCMRFGQIWNGLGETTATTSEGTLKGERVALACPR